MIPQFPNDPTSGAVSILGAASPGGRTWIDEYLKSKFGQNLLSGEQTGSTQGYDASSSTSLAPGASRTGTAGSSPIANPDIYSADFSLSKMMAQAQGRKPSPFEGAAAALKGANFGPGEPVMKGYGPTWGQNFLTGLATGVSNVGAYQQKEGDAQEKLLQTLALAGFRNNGLNQYREGELKNAADRNKTYAQLEADRALNTADRNDTYAQRVQGQNDVGKQRADTYANSVENNALNTADRNDTYNQRVQSQNETDKTRLDQGQQKIDQNQPMIDEKIKGLKSTVDLHDALIAKYKQEAARGGVKGDTLGQINNALKQTGVDLEKKQTRLKALDDKGAPNPGKFYDSGRTPGEEKEFNKLQAEIKVLGESATNLEGAVNKHSLTDNGQIQTGRTGQPPSPPPPPDPLTIPINGQQAQTQIFNGKNYQKVQGGWQLIPGQ